MRWILAETDAGRAERLSAEAGLHPLIARLLINRGITDPAAARTFLSSDLSSLSDPGIFPDMEKAVRRISAAVSAGEGIAVYGDYDVDGVTASALLYRVLTGLGAKVVTFIPNRLREGYGLNAGALSRLRERGVRVVITVDCGISAVAEAAHGREIGLDLIITDHHEIPGTNGGPEPANGRSAALPEAVALLHPALLRADVPESVRDAVSGLTGVGVAFKLAQALLRARADDERLRRPLALVTLGTIADVGKITGENRVFVKQGLELLSSDPAAAGPGIAALRRVANLADRQVTAGNVGFALAPRINAGGRLESADSALRLLITDDPAEADCLAAELDAANRERQDVEEAIRAEAESMVRALDLDETGAIVLASAGWHPGVVGIVASRIAEGFYRPTALIALQDGVGKGSARSIPGFDLYHALTQCRDLLIGYGGHRFAAGFSIAEERISSLRDCLNSRALEQGRAGGGFRRTLTIDGALPLGDLTLDLVRELERLAPFGQGNPEPKFGSRGLTVLSSRIVGNNHLKLRVRQDDGTTLDAIGFGRGDLHGRGVRENVRVAAVYTPKVNTWNGSASVELEIRDIKVEKG